MTYLEAFIVVKRDIIVYHSVGFPEGNRLVATGANMSLIYGMVPDTIEYSEMLTKGERMDGFLNTISSFWNKVGITIGTAGAGWILGLVGYIPNAGQQTAGVILALDLMKWTMPAMFSVIAMICLIWYRLDYATFDKLVADLNEKRPQWEAERKASSK